MYNDMKYLCLRSFSQHKHVCTLSGIIIIMIQLFELNSKKSNENLQKQWPRYVIIFDQIIIQGFPWSFRYRVMLKNRSIVALDLRSRHVRVLVITDQLSLPLCHLPSIQSPIANTHSPTFSPSPYHPPPFSSPPLSPRFLST